MAFLIYQRAQIDGMDVLTRTGEQYRLAGHNLIHSIWEIRGRPINRGWSVGVDELIRLRTGGQNDYNSMRFLIDFDPKSRRRIGIIELLRVYGYTYWNHAKQEVDWTPLMLEARRVFYQEFEREITLEDKEHLISEFIGPDYGPPFVEFLYLNGDRKGWNWGANGRTNAPVIEGGTREYFRRFF